jgi:hypothetical protein
MILKKPDLRKCGLAQDRDQWRALVDTVMKPSTSIKRRDKRQPACEGGLCSVELVTISACTINKHTVTRMYMTAKDAFGKHAYSTGVQRTSHCVPPATHVPQRARLGLN